jgi:acyl-CoA thioesterase-1
VNFVLKRRDFNAQCLTAVLAASLTTSLHAVTPPTILVVGDSLSAEYGIARGSGWVALLADQLRQQSMNWQVMNASISGDTTSGGLARLNTLLKQHQPKVVVIELGGNDALRGFSLSMSENNLVQMVKACQAVKAKVLLVGMQVPPNYGAAYARDFTNMFARIAKQHQTGLVPFMLQGVADTSDPTAMFQADRIHPTAKAHPIILANIWPQLKKLL